ncbi:leucyl aminopeptidase [Brachybacterium halotolerans subsp. kimchii]|uniref:leucyl aminopeptidase n=1 Tax=Brachybacterium halotolerans TaxID=2795215 RepID=UPI001E50077A|nr:leucyl aminopeptidase [Brachybacterium halotolerans]UEJ83140.1 leucyl aminopeptidase [Brachybacterium halotolerans subsp. kimchii]
MVSITTSPSTVQSVTADVLILPVLSGEEGAGPAVLGLPELSPVLAAVGASGAQDELTRLPAPEGVTASTVLLAGLGRRSLDDADAVVLRRALGGATRSLTGVGSAAVAVPGGTGEQLAAAAEGAALGAYSFTAHKSDASSATAPLQEIVLVADESTTGDGAVAASERAGILADVVNVTRDLVNTPPNLLYPESFAQRVGEIADGLPLEVTVLDEEQLAAGGYGGIVGVGQGSARPPRLVRVRYAPEGATGHVALVGKGITFDTGGISLKPGPGMDDMTSDMTGAATVLAAAVGAARLNLPVKVTAFLAIAENMPGGGAQRPGDVVTMRNGRTVEVLNTDAEGRMVMADALVDAVAEQPDLVMDVATLTGAAVVALGDRTAAVMGTDEARTEVLAAADAAGEPFWPLPFPEELRAGIDGRVADLRNIGAGRAGGALTAGIFLREFVGGTPWAHLDIAGPGFADSPQGYMGKGATGMSVRTVLAVLEARAR